MVSKNQMTKHTQLSLGSEPFASTSILLMPEIKFLEVSEGQAAPIPQLSPTLLDLNFVPKPSLGAAVTCEDVLPVLRVPLSKGFVGLLYLVSLVLFLKRCVQSTKRHFCTQGFLSHGLKRTFHDVWRVKKTPNKTRWFGWRLLGMGRV